MASLSSRKPPDSPPKNTAKGEISARLEPVLDPEPPQQVPLVHGAVGADLRRGESGAEERKWVAAVGMRVQSAGVFSVRRASKVHASSEKLRRHVVSRLS